MRISRFVLVATLPACAHARDPGLFVSPGLLYAPGIHPSRAAGVGGEISSVYYGEGNTAGYGPVVQAEWQPSDGPRTSASRFAAEAEVVYGPFGLDAGWALRTSGGQVSPWATGPQVGAFFSIAQASIGVRAMIPAAHGDAGGRDVTDTSMVVTLKLPILVYGERPEFVGSGSGFNPFPNLGRMPSGRPLTIEGTARTAALTRTTSWTV